MMGYDDDEEYEEMVKARDAGSKEEAANLGAALAGSLT